MKFGTPLLVLGMLLFLERINTKVNTIQEDVQEIKRGMTWQDTCIAKHEEINRRLAHLERKVLNG
ncbi:hypothetical protein ACFL1R_07410 [Candidatus Latescibacterota bacterium]